ncbi:MAG: PEP-CTERM sorting domain-containing protein [Verrucomicrobiota bacterium]
MKTNVFQKFIGKVALGLVMGSPVTIVADNSFTGLGTMGGGVGSHAFGISADGMVVIGVVIGGNAEWDVGFRWTEGRGKEVLGHFDNLSHNVTQPRGISADGTVIAGMATYNDSWPWGFVWTPTSGMVNLGVACNTPRAVSADGKALVGTGANEIGQPAAFRRTSQGVSFIGPLSGGRFADAYGVSADGSVVIGTSQSSVGDRAFRWAAGEGMTGLGVIPGAVSSEGYGISGNGLVVVGSSAGHAVRWNKGEDILDLGDPEGATSGQSVAVAASDDGSVIVGRAAGSAFIWDVTHGSRWISEMLTNDFGLDLEGWGLDEALSISADGRTIVGNGFRPTPGGAVSSVPEGWIAKVGDVTIPRLAIGHKVGPIVLSWPDRMRSWRLEYSATPTAGPGGWSELPPPYATSGVTSMVTEPVLASGRFYRLRKAGP